MASTITRTCEPTAKTNVFRSAVRNLRLSMIDAKFLSPTKCNARLPAVMSVRL